MLNTMTQDENLKMMKLFFYRTRNLAEDHIHDIFSIIKLVDYENYCI